MKVLLISHAMVVPTTWSKSRLLAQSIEIVTVVPSKWETFGDVHPLYPENFISLPIFLPNRNHFHVYPFIYDFIASHSPDLLHIDEEPYSLVTAHLTSVANRLRIPVVVFTWQNIFKQYPLPFRLLERYVLKSARGLICGNGESEAVFRRKGFNGYCSVIPQFGVEDQNFIVKDWGVDRGHLRVVFAGRLVKEKGVDLLISAVARLPFIQAVIAGGGPEAECLRAQSHRLGVSARVEFLGPVSGSGMARLIAECDVLVLPSRTTPAWKEQFGRVLVEAMAAGTVVVGSSSGEIPNVIGDAGLVFREGDVGDLCEKLLILKSGSLRQEFGLMGVERAKKLFTQEKIVAATLNFYHRILS